MPKSTRTNTAKWNDKRKLWYIAVQKDNVRRFFYSSTPGRTGQRECNARRTFRLTPIARGVLDAQRAMLDAAGIESEYVFCTQWGDNLTQKLYRSRWIRYRDYNKLSDSVTPYELRHTFVSIVKSLPEGMIKDIVGHSQNMDTLGTYSHELTGDMERTANEIYNVFNNLIFAEENESVVKSVVQ